MKFNMSKRTDAILLSDIIESGHKILRYTQNMTFEDFGNDEKTIDAVIRNFEVIGEAANHLTESFKDQHPNIDWFRIRGFRNRIIHDYAGVDLNIVWNIIIHYLPQMMNNLDEIGN